MSDTVVKNFKTKGYIQSLNVGKMQSDKMDEITVLEQVDRNRYIVDYKGVKCYALFNWFNCSYYVDDVYGVVGENKRKTAKSLKQF